MGRRSRGDSFASDSRAVAPLVGFILLFGLLVVVLAGYQAQVVPQQNADVEFQHFEENRNEMIQLRNAISTAGQSNVSQFPSVRLGTTYQTRTLTVNPPPPVGTLQTTSEAYPITISDGDTDVEIPTRFLEYQPGYNELNVGSTWYENSVLYLDEGESSNPVIIEEQNLITDGDKLKITALQNEFRQSGTSRVTLELYPTRSSQAEIDQLEGELTVSIPTRLTDSDHWEILNETLTENSAIRSHGVDNSSEIGDGVFELELEVDDKKKIAINTVGIRSEPTEGTAQQNVGPSGGEGGGAGNGGGTSSGDTPLDYRELDTANDGDLEFSAVNIAGETVTVTGFGVDATPLANNPRLDNEDDNEVEIEPDDGQTGFANRDGEGANGRYDADGSLYDLDESANLQNNEEVTINIQGIRSQNGNRLDFDLERTANAANADVTVTLQFASRDAQVFYFEDRS